MLWRRGRVRRGEVAKEVGVDDAALEKLLNLLVATGYLRFRDGRYALTRLSRKWLPSDSPHSLHDSMLLRFLEWQAIEATEDFVRSGKALDVHDRIRGDQWGVYQRGMRSLARLSAGEVAARVKIPAGSRAMLDIGGGHGTYAVAFCRRHPELKATILDLPSAVEVAAPILAEEKMGERVVHRPGNALSDDLGSDAWDLIFISHLVHHFDQATNAELLRRAGACTPSGRRHCHPRRAAPDLARRRQPDRGASRPLFCHHQQFRNLVFRGDCGLAGEGGAPAGEADRAPPRAGYHRGDRQQGDR